MSTRTTIHLPTPVYFHGQLVPITVPSPQQPHFCWYGAVNHEFRISRLCTPYGMGVFLKRQVLRVLNLVYLSFSTPYIIVARRQVPTICIYISKEIKSLFSYLTLYTRATLERPSNQYFGAALTQHLGTIPSTIPRHYAGQNTRFFLIVLHIPLICKLELMDIIHFVSHVPFVCPRYKICTYFQNLSLTNTGCRWDQSPRAYHLGIEGKIIPFLHASSI